MEGVYGVCRGTHRGVLLANPGLSLRLDSMAVVRSTRVLAGDFSFASRTDISRGACFFIMGLLPNMLFDVK